MVKRVYGLIGSPRSGKSEVANFLKKTRDFAVLAFANEIKEEFGIGKDEFEALKNTAEIDRVRQQLWDFSAARKKIDPLYFIRGVIKKAELSESSVVITDIRTKDELAAFFNCKAPICNLFHICGPLPDAQNGFIIGSEIPDNLENVRIITNKKQGLISFHQYLEDFFSTEDISDSLLQEGINE